MNRSLLSILGVGAVAGALLVAVVVSTDADAAPKTQPGRVFDDSTLKNTHGSYAFLPDGGVLWECCGSVSKPDGGPFLLEFPCTQAAGATMNTAYNTCAGKWVQVNELNAP